MQSILEAFAFDNLNTHPTYFKRGTAYARMMGERADLYEKLMTQFSQEQMHILDKLQETESSLSLTDNANYFSYGFQLGALMMIEVFTKMDRLVGEEEAPPVEK